MHFASKREGRESGFWTRSSLAKIALLQVLVSSAPSIGKPAETTTPTNPPSTPAQVSPDKPHNQGAEDVEINKIKEQYWARGNEVDLGVVQNRLYPKTHRLELSLTGTTVKGDPFLSIYSLGLSAGYHFSEFLSVHVLGWKTFVGASSALKTLQSQLNTTTNTNEPKGFIGTEGRASVLYGKVSLLGAAILYFDSYFSLGGGLISTESGKCGLISWGLGQEFHFSRSVSFNLGYRFLWYRETILGKISGPAGSNVGQNLGTRSNLSNEISLGFSFFFDPFGLDPQEEGKQH